MSQHVASCSSLNCEVQPPVNEEVGSIVKDTTTSYDAVKEFEGRKYTGMRVGGSHNWCYRSGEWKETKTAPDKWEFTYLVNKRRKWDAPEGSGAPTGTEYHWYVLAHQKVRKLNANEYTTSMAGVKYKLAHRRPGSEDWSESGRAQLRHLIGILEENMIQLRHELGEVGEDSGAAHRGVDSLSSTIKPRREMTSGRRMTSNGLALAMLGQLPLETYTLQSGAGVTGSAGPSVGSGSSTSSKSEFFPKNNR